MYMYLLKKTIGVLSIWVIPSINQLLDILQVLIKMNQQKSTSNYLFCVWCTFVDDDSSHVEAHWEDGVLSASITTADDIIVIEVSVFVK